MSKKMILMVFSLLTLAPAAMSVTASADPAPLYWIKIGVEPDGSLRCKVNSNCHPLYSECCATPGME